MIATLLVSVCAYAIQVHLTAKFTADVGEDSNASTWIAHRAFAFSDISVNQVCCYFGIRRTEAIQSRDQSNHYFDNLVLLTALLLCILGTRRLRCVPAVVDTLDARTHPHFAIDNAEESHLGAAVLSAGVGSNLALPIALVLRLPTT